MVVLNKKSFKLPFMDREKFVLLMRLGLSYDRASGTFCLNSFNNIEKLSTLLAEILGVNEVVFTQTCKFCGKDFSCADCRYLDLCPTKNQPFQCVCQDCLRKGNSQGAL